MKNTVFISNKWHNGQIILVITELKKIEFDRRRSMKTWLDKWLEDKRRAYERRINETKIVPETQAVSVLSEIVSQKSNSHNTVSFELNSSCDSWTSVVL